LERQHWRGSVEEAVPRRLVVVGIVGRIGNQSFSNSRGVWGKAVGAAYREKQKASEAGIYVLRRSCSSVGEEIAERRGEETTERRQQRWKILDAELC
jgi:tRNA pseudouridine-54 N-methylase